MGLMNGIPANMDECNAKIVHLVRCNAQCADDCDAESRGWFVTQADDGKFYVIAGHDTASFDGEGDFIGYGAYWQCAEAFETQEQAQAYLKEFCR